MNDSAPQIVSVLASPVIRLPGIGSVRARVLEDVGVRNMGDLLRLIPRRYLDRSAMPHIGEIKVPRKGTDELTIVGKIKRIAVVPGRKPRTVVTLMDTTGTFECVWFGKVDWLSRMFSPNERVAVSGKLKRFRSVQMVHPEIESIDEQDGDLVHTGRIIPVYPQRSDLSACGLHTRGFRRLIRRLLDHYGERIVDPIPLGIQKRHQLCSLTTALRQAHFPDSFRNAHEARRRLVFDEFLGLQLAVVGKRLRRAAEEPGVEFVTVGERFKQLLDRLPFELTDGQKQVLREIRRDMCSNIPMNRLLQGDVGSGKTLVALFSALIAVDNGYQAAIMAPTEVLAEQHALTIGRLLFEVGVDCVLITGSTPTEQRRRALAEVAAGQIPVVVGTHALLSGDVEFLKLGFVVVDEQHRFGVLQREALRRKGPLCDDRSISPDVLVMTATPIPRSLTQTLYGDMDVSVLNEKPPGRLPIRTVRSSARSAATMWKNVRQALSAGEQAYIVHPLIEQSHTADLKAATEGYEEVRDGELKGFRLGLMHGRMSTGERDRVMADFKTGQVDVLVCTTVIEVGVDVTNATVMVIEGAERFGLAQLHQLRGRIGRGTRPSTCYLVPGGKLTEDADKRLEAVVESDDGFYLAEIDLEIRGPGEFFGTKQSGMPELRLANIVRDSDILTVARDVATAVLADDPSLATSDHLGLRPMMAPFERALKEAAEVGSA